MAYITVDDLRLGMDRRRKRVAGTPGSLWTLKNGHLTRGGDIERAKKWVSTYALPAGETQGMASVGDTLYVFGSAAAPSVPAGVTYQRLRHPDGSTALSSVLDVQRFDGKLYVIAEFADGDVYHFYDAALVTDWFYGLVRDDMGATGTERAEGIAEQFKIAIDADEDYSATRASNVVSITGTGDLSFEAEGEVDGDGAMAFATTQTAVASTAEVLATAQVTVTGSSGSMASITVDGVDVLGAAVNYTSSPAVFAANIAAQINNYASAPDYTASASGSTVTISASAGTGSDPNGYTVVATPGGAITAVSTNMSGGSAAISGQNQVTTVTFNSDAAVDDEYSIELTRDNETKPFGVTGNPTPVARLALTFKNKVHAAGSSLVNFSGVNQPTRFNRDHPDVIGAGFINAANQEEGSQDVTALGIYQGQLLVFARRSAQIWQIDQDPENNVFVQPLNNTGTPARHSVLSYGNNDVFYLDDTGIRSIKARNNSDSAFSSDVGTAVDSFVQTYLATLTDAQVAAAVACYEPTDGRFMLAAGARIFVFSYFPTSKISAWSYYEPGFSISDFTSVGKRLYARSGDTIYLYGGADNATYPDDDEQVLEVELPFLDGKTPATKKIFNGVDAAVENEWAVFILPNPNDETQEIDVGRINQITYTTGKWPFNIETTHVAARLRCDRAGAASISSLAFHYEATEAE